MPTEQNKLTEARKLFARFETEMDRPEGLTYLSDALSILADIRADSESENIKQVTSNIALAYAKKVQAQVELLLSHKQPVHWETVEHWQKVFSEYSNSEFVPPQEIAETFSKLKNNKIEQAVKLMPPEERKRLIEQILKKED